MTDHITIVAHGTPITQGSKTRTQHGMRDDNSKTLKPWRKKVTAAAEAAMRYHDPLQGPVSAVIVFAFARPPSHHRTGRNADLLRDAAPAMPCQLGYGDIDKLQRACLDSLADAGVFGNDAQVCDVRARKVYAGESEHGLDQPGVRIHVRQIEQP